MNTTTTTPPPTADKKSPELLRQSCENCSKGKVKCEGNNPCLRCTKKGLECVFLHQRKRGRRATSPQSTTATLQPPSVAATAAVAALSTFQRRMFRIVFSLFKYHRDATDITWFALRFNQLGGLLQQQHHFQDECFKLGTFLHRQGVPILTTIPIHVSKLQPRLVNLPRSSSVIAALQSQQQAPSSTQPQQQQPIFLGCILYSAETSVVCCPETQKWFGFDRQGANFPFPRVLTTEFLPWGADVLCAIGDDDSQILSFVRDVALELQTAAANKQTSRVTLVDRPFTVRTATASVKCLMSCTVDCTTPSSKVAFYFVLDPATRHDAFGVTLPVLQDLELGPWVSENWLDALIDWAL